MSKSVFSGVILMSSKLLEQAIVDAQALRDSAFKSAQATLLEKFAPQVKEAVEKLLEQEEEPGAETPPPSDALAGGDSTAPVTDFGGAPQMNQIKAMFPVRLKIYLLPLLMVKNFAHAQMMMKMLLLN